MTSDIKKILDEIDGLREEAIGKEKYDIYMRGDKTGYIAALHNNHSTLRNYIARLEREAEAGRVLATEIASSYFVRDPQEEHLCENCKEDHAYTNSLYVHRVLKGLLFAYRSACEGEEK